MDNVTKTILVDILGKEEMSYYDAAQLFKGVASLLEDTSLSMGRILGEGKEDAEKIVDMARSKVAQLIEVNNEIDTVEGEFYEKLDATLSRIREAHQKAQKQLNNMPEFRFPFVSGLNNLVEVASRCSSLTDEQWARVIDLAKVLGGER